MGLKEEEVEKRKMFRWLHIFLESVIPFVSEEFRNLGLITYGLREEYVKFVLL
jgi:hypothetical protein